MALAPSYSVTLMPGWEPEESWVSEGPTDVGNKCSTRGCFLEKG